ncbi:KUP system potassium uptake protein [Novosphingobium nitrogenifigens DSM 19370]|uniref:Probable potassium transport system protein Kup n=1 Tax=Novosphingobium nitrogenifigens DSM 19370 TaxID=983920 RepID=F1ZBF1_9SPHN|nr:potassium transporter Kup [Novosphingobium nitrogenifigens]EGD58151.1 KUP system potassium uptake protein [Novosphingobium nitrogenifigens DSM 19370]
MTDNLHATPAASADQVDPVAQQAAPADCDNHHHGDSLRTLAIGAIGVVFGDIGTSPLYSLRESFIGAHPLAVDPAHIFGVLSLIFWTMTLVVTIKYVFIILHADNKGEGGSLALLALIGRKLGQTKWSTMTVLCGIIATALFYGDAIITPAMSVLSAVEGLEVVEPAFEKLVLPISIAILIGLFAIQSRGTAAVGKLFGPIMLVYFAVIGILGIMGIMHAPEILWSLNPIYAYRFFALDPMLAFLALGSVVLAVTGAEALYADMGHFGRKAIMIAWLWVAFPCLLINYMGQSALLLKNPKLVENPFFLMAPEWGRLPLVILATMATIIASQAVISGAYSISQQAIQLGFLPRIRIQHTSAKAAGQIYVPLVNWLLLVLVLLLVVGFRSSNNLASAYGIAVTGTMFITACMLGILTFAVWQWPPLLAGSLTGAFLLVDGAYFASNITKIPDGGWFPLLIAAIVFTVLTTWSTGRRILRERLAEDSMPFDLFLNSVCDKVRRVPGTSVFLSSTSEGIPPALLHNLKHNHILHQRVVILTVVTEGVPHVPQASRRTIEDIGHGFFRMIIRIGFMDEANIPAELSAENRAGGPFKPMETSYFLARQTLIPSKRPGMALWREKLFAWMVRNAESAMQFFRLPTNRVIELGSQLEI